MELHIGGTDNPVIKHPHTLEPYIPGSSIKGKVRSMMELASGLVAETRKQEGENATGLVSLKTLTKLGEQSGLKKEAEAILKIFGHSGSDSKDSLASDLGPTRVSFADCHLKPEWVKKAQENRWPLTEEKSENSINRIKGVAEHPRFTERVPAGAEFEFLLTFKVLSDGDEQLFDKLLGGLRLLESDALGGSGSRGYGRISFDRLYLDEEDISEKFSTIKPF